MHIPDGFLDPAWIMSTYLIAITYYIVSVKKYLGRIDPDKISLLTVVAATIFVAQMLNWPLPGGTSLHLVGGGLAAIILGPILGSLALGIVVTIQCLVFHDGGLTALGANLLNMAIVAVLTAYIIYRTIVKHMGFNDKSVFLAGFLGGWISIFLAGIVCGIEIGLSPQFPYGVYVTVPVMGTWHFILGVIEGLITGSTVLYIYKRNPSLLYQGWMR